MTDLRKRLLSRITPPATEPLTLAETKTYLRVDHSTEDSLIIDLIVVARMAAEEWLRRSLITQAWKLAYDGYLNEEERLPMIPVISITSVIQYERDGSWQTISNTSYALSASKEQLRFDNPLLGYRFEITYATGYGDATQVPKPIKYGMLSHIASLYDHRGDAKIATLPEQSIQLYAPYREIVL